MDYYELEDLLHTEIRPTGCDDFHELWIGGRFVGMYENEYLAKRAATSPYATACRGAIARNLI